MRFSEGSFRGVDRRTSLYVAYLYDESSVRGQLAFRTPSP